MTLDSMWSKDEWGERRSLPGVFRPRWMRRTTHLRIRWGAVFSYVLIAGLIHIFCRGFNVDAVSEALLIYVGLMVVHQFVRPR